MKLRADKTVLGALALAAALSAAGGAAAESIGPEHYGEPWSAIPAPPDRRPDPLPALRLGSHNQSARANDSDAPQFITLYEEADLAQESEPGSAPAETRAAAAPASDSAENSPDVTASITQAPETSGAPADAMRPVSTAGDAAPPPLNPGSLTLPPPPAVDVTIAVQDEAVLARVRALLAEKATFSGSRLDAAQQDGIRRFYGERTTPLWLAKGAWTPRARAVQGVLERAWEDGLEPAHYPLPDLPAAVEAVEILADAEVRQSINAVAYARDASGGRLNLAQLSRHITMKPPVPASADVLADLASADADGQDAAGQNAATRLSDYNPKHAGYLALRQKLVSLRAMRPPEQPMARVPQGPVLQIGMSDPRVALVRSRLGLTPADDALYDEDLAKAVAEFQRQRRLKPTGRLTRQTVLAMAGNDVPSAQDESALIVNMERWRWLPRELGARYIFVNVPEYRMRMISDGALAYDTRIVVGKAQTPTPIFSDVMQYTVINPSWHVPPSILRKEFIPGLAKDPAYAAKRGYEVVRRGNSIQVRQPPGERNALGRIKFMFPNDHAVYLHDTPSKALFGRSKRAFSHGCVRVDQPLRLGELVLGPGWTEARIKRLIGRGERTVRLQQPLPIHLAYFTASVDAKGALHAREDIYGLDVRMRAALERLNR